MFEPKFEASIQPLRSAGAAGDIVFLSLAEGGAMGRPGDVVIVTKNADTVKWYRCNYLENISESELTFLLPPLETFQVGLFGSVSGVPSDWAHIDLGMGNHLLVRWDLYPAFMREAETLPQQRPGLIYQNWQEFANRIL